MWNKIWNEIKAFFGFGWELMREEEITEANPYDIGWIRRKVRIERNKYTGKRRMI